MRYSLKVKQLAIEAGALIKQDNEKDYITFDPNQLAEFSKAIIKHYVDTIQPKVYVRK